MAPHTVLNGLFFLEKQRQHMRDSGIAFQHSYFASRILGSNIKYSHNIENKLPNTKFVSQGIKRIKIQSSE
jgi:hypothetical protein